MNAPRFAAAFFVAPLAVFIPFVGIATFAEQGGMWAAIGLAATAMAYLGMLVIGLPAILVLHRLHLTKWWQATLAGAIGPVVFTWSDNTNALLTFCLSGAFVAMVAWFIAFYRLDRTCDRSVSTNARDSRSNASEGSPRCSV